MSTAKILIQLDRDQHASSFDAVVAVDAGVDQLLQYGHVEPADVRDLVHGAMFTRGLGELMNTAIFVGGSDVGLAEELMRQVTDSFFGPMRVSVMLDANGANTTAAAAVVAASRHLDLGATTATVLAGTGPVGQRVVQLLAGDGCHVQIASRSIDRAQAVCDKVSATLHAEGLVTTGSISPALVDSPDDIVGTIANSQLVVAAGAAGIELLPLAVRQTSPQLKVVIDLNAVPPLGVAGTEVTDKAAERDGVVCYGAVGVGGTKMKIHREAVRRLFTTNDLELDARQVYEIGREVG